MDLGPEDFRFEHVKDHKLWLNALPEDLQQRIVIRAILAKGDERKNAMSLAETSASLRKIVVSIEASRLQSWDEMDEKGRYWARLLTGRFCWVSVTPKALAALKKLKCPVQKGYGSNAMSAIFTSTSLQKAIVPEDIQVSKFLQSAGSVTDLEVHLQDTDHTVLIETIAKLPLNRLKLECGGVEGSKSCIASLVERHGTDVLGVASPNVEELELSCRTCSFEVVSCIVEQFSSLKKVSLMVNDLPDRTPAVLEALDFLHIIVCNGCFSEFKPSLRSLVTSLEASWEAPFESIDAEALKDSQRLSSLDISLDPGVEETLADVVQNLPKLKSLRLEWTEGHTPLLGTISRMIQSRPRLQVLRLENVCLGQEEVEEILRTLGSNLRVFGTSVDSQLEPPHERVIAVMNAILDYNENLQELHIPIDSSFSSVDSTELQEYRYRMHLLQRELLTKVPELNHYRVEKYCDHVCNCE